jgi:hypothetical protein
LANIKSLLWNGFLIKLNPMKKHFSLHYLPAQGKPKIRAETGSVITDSLAAFIIGRAFLGEGAPPFSRSDTRWYFSS